QRVFPNAPAHSRNMTTLTLRAPDDFHHHFRDGDVLKTLVPLASAQFARCLAMPNLVPPVLCAADVKAYRDRLLAAGQGGKVFEPIMTLYLTDKTTPDMVQEAFDTGYVKALKLYPAGATTNSQFGITNYEDCLPALKKMAELGLILCVHGESTDQTLDIFDREARFYSDVMPSKIVNRVDGLKVVCEHITTRAAVDFVKNAGSNVAATITAHHLLHNRNDIFKGGIRPHMYCLPVLKREEDRASLVAAATSGSPKFFAGTDSAPHAVERKESSCGCAGVFTAHAAMAFYAEAFEAVGALDKLEAFTSINGAQFYSMPLNEKTVTLTKKEVTLPEVYEFGSSKVVPLRAGGAVGWDLTWN
ncbi:Dihydroorotase, partial [Diplonema papillatum]